MGNVSCPTVSRYFIWTLLLIQLERWARKVSLWIFHSMEAGWSFVTGQNETTNMWWNQDLQAVVHTPRPPASSLYVWYMPWIFPIYSELYILFSHRGNLNYCSLSLFYVCYIRCLCQARVNERTGKQAWWRGVPRPQALFKKTF